MEMGESANREEVVYIVHIVSGKPMIICWSFYSFNACKIAASSQISLEAGRIRKIIAKSNLDQTYCKCVMHRRHGSYDLCETCFEDKAF